MQIQVNDLLTVVNCELPRQIKAFKFAIGARWPTQEPKNWLWHLICNNKRQQQKKQKWETSHRKCTFNLEECEKFRKKKETIDGLNKDGGWMTTENDCS